MKTALIAVLALLVLDSGSATAQSPGRTATEQIEAIVTVTAVDRQERSVTVRGPRGDTVTVHVPNAQNLDQVRPGSRFKLLYTEAAAVAITKGNGTPSASVGGSVEGAPKGANPGGIARRVLQVTAKVEAIDRDNRYLSVKGPQGDTVAVKVPQDVTGLDKISVGDMVTLRYEEALAIDMLPEEGKPKS